MLYFPCFRVFGSWRCFTSISLLPLSGYRSKLAEWFFRRWFTSLWSINVIEWKSHDFCVCKDLISANVFVPPWISPPGRRFRTTATYCFLMARYQFGVQRVTTEGIYSAKCVFSFWRMRNGELLVFSCPGGSLRLSHIIAALATVLCKSRRFARSLVVFPHVSNVDTGWEPP